MLRAQFPSPAVRKALQTAIENKAAADIRDPKTTVLVVKHSGREDEDKVVAFAKWSHPVCEGEHYVEPPWSWPEGTDYAILGAWTNKTEEGFERALGSTPCYRESSFGAVHRSNGRTAHVRLYARKTSRLTLLQVSHSSALTHRTKVRVLVPYL